MKQCYLSTDDEHTYIQNVIQSISLLFSPSNHIFVHRILLEMYLGTSLLFPAPISLVFPTLLHLRYGIFFRKTQISNRFGRARWDEAQSVKVLFLEQGDSVVCTVDGNFLMYYYAGHLSLTFCQRTACQEGEKQRKVKWWQREKIVPIPCPLCNF